MMTDQNNHDNVTTANTPTANSSSNSNSDSFIPKVVTDFIFDIYDSITLSQIHIEQMKLYTITFPELCTVYYPNTSWPSPAQIASECNGDPLFLAIYRELIHRYYFNNNNIRPTLTDRIEGWDVYKELFDEIFESSSNHQDAFYLVPIYVFEILFEFIYQFQGYCQIKSAVYATAKKNHFIDEYGNRITTTTTTATGTTTTAPTTTIDSTDSTTSATTATTTPSPPATTTSNTQTNTKHVNLLENLSILEQNMDAWDVSVVFQYLLRFQQMAGFNNTNKFIDFNLDGNNTSTITTTNPSSSSSSSSSNNNNNNNTKIPVVHMYFGIYSCICQSRLECLLGDYYGCLMALDPLSMISSNDLIIKKDDESWTVSELVNDVVMASRVSLSYHIGISYLQLHRYYDAYTILMNCTTILQRGFKTGTIRNDLFQKQYDRMISLLIIIVQICPGITKNNNNSSSNTGAGSSTTTTTTNTLVVVMDDASPQYDESMIRMLREKHSSSKIEMITTTATTNSTNSSGNSKSNNNNNNNNNNNTTGNSNSSNSTINKNYEEWFASPKFITSHPMMIGGSYYHKLQIDLFHTTNMKFFIMHGTTLRSFLKLYTSIPIDKLASFHDIPIVKDFIPILLTYKSRLQYQIQRIRITSSSESNGVVVTSSSSPYSTGLRSIDVNSRGNNSNGISTTDISIVNPIQDDLHYYIENDIVSINEAEEQRHLESYLCQQMKQLQSLHQTIVQLDMKI